MTPDTPPDPGADRVGSPAAPTAGPGWITFLIAAACGLIAANLYFAQPLIGLIGPELGLTPAQSGLIVTLTQVGYGLGLLFVVPLGDLFENRRLILTVLALGIVAALGLALARTPSVFLAFCFLIGLGSVSVQILVPLAAHLAPPEMRGRVVGRVMSGLLLGIMLARPASSLITELAGWRVVFFGTAACSPCSPSAPALPALAPAGGPARLRRADRLDGPARPRHAAAPAPRPLPGADVRLVQPVLDHDPAAPRRPGLRPVAGPDRALRAGRRRRGDRRADRRRGRRPRPRPARHRALDADRHPRLSWSATSARRARPASLAALVAAAVLLDFGVTGCLVFSQRAIYSLSDSARSRLNGIFMATFFGGGALGSALGAWTLCPLRLGRDLAGRHGLPGAGAARLRDPQLLRARRRADDQPELTSSEQSKRTELSYWLRDRRYSQVRAINRSCVRHTPGKSAVEHGIGLLAFFVFGGFFRCSD